MNIREMRAQLGDTQSEFSARYHIPFRTVQIGRQGCVSLPNMSLICWSSVSRRT